MPHFQNGADGENKDTKTKPSPEVIGAAIRAVQSNIKTHLSTIQKSMQLYLANKETEFILFKLIRVNFFLSTLRCIRIEIE